MHRFLHVLVPLDVISVPSNTALVQVLPPSPVRSRQEPSAPSADRKAAAPTFRSAKARGRAKPRRPSVQITLHQRIAFSSVDRAEQKEKFPRPAVAEVRAISPRALQAACRAPDPAAPSLSWASARAAAAVFCGNFITCEAVRRSSGVGAKHIGAVAPSCRFHNGQRTKIPAASSTLRQNRPATFHRFFPPPAGGPNGAYAIVCQRFPMD